MRETKRKDWIDIAKGLGMILVILGHCVPFGGKMHNLIFAFHMPFFFLLSGLVFKQTQIRVVAKKRLKTLIVPYILFCLLGIVLTLLLGPRASWKDILRDLYLGNPEHLWVSSVWFLVALFITTVLFAVILKLKNILAQKIIVAILFVGGIAFGTVYHAGIINHRLPLDIDVVPVALLFFAVGYYIKNKLLAEKKDSDNPLYARKKIFLLCVLAVAFILSSMINVRVNLHGIEYGNPVLFVIAAFTGSFAVIIFSQLLVRQQQIKKICVWIGKNNIYYLGAQAIGVRLFLKLFNAVQGTEYALYGLPYIPGFIAFIFTFFFATVFTVVIQTIKKIMTERSYD